MRVVSDLRNLLVDDLDQVFITSLEGLGSSYRMKGYFTMNSKGISSRKIAFEGVAFGGNYGGHNVNVSIADEEKALIMNNARSAGDGEIEDLLTEIQRRLLNNEMIVDYDVLKPDSQDDLSDGLGKV